MDAHIRSASIVSGVLAVLVAFGGIAVAVTLAPWFDLTHALSDLGRAGRTSRPAFNLAMILSGLLGLGYVPALRHVATSRWHHAAIVVAAITIAAMAGVGVFPTPHPFHLPAAVTLYIGITVLFLVWGAGDLHAGRRHAAYLGMAAAPIHVLSWILWAQFAENTAVAGLALPELVGAVLFAGWVIGTAIRARR